VTNLAERFHVLTAAVVDRGCGVPVAWAVRPAGVKGSWNPHRGRLLDRVAAALGPGWQVVVLTDRGRESAELVRVIAARGFHPLMRAKAGGSFRPAGWHKFHPLGAFAARPGGRFAAPGGVPDRPARLHPAGGPGGRVRGRLAGADRPAGGGRRAVLVRPAERGRAGVLR
jgi:hypothetical protein